MTPRIVALFISAALDNKPHNRSRISTALHARVITDLVTTLVLDTAVQCFPPHDRRLNSTLDRCLDLRGTSHAVRVEIPIEASVTSAVQKCNITSTHWYRICALVSAAMCPRVVTSDAERFSRTIIVCDCGFIVGKVERYLPIHFVRGLPLVSCTAGKNSRPHGWRRLTILPGQRRPVSILSVEQVQEDQFRWQIVVGQLLAGLEKTVYFPS